MVTASSPFVYFLLIFAFESIGLNGRPSNDFLAKVIV